MKPALAPGCRVYAMDATRHGPFRAHYTLIEDIDGQRWKRHGRWWRAKDSAGNTILLHEEDIRKEKED